MTANTMTLNTMALNTITLNTIPINIELNTQHKDTHHSALNIMMTINIEHLT
jgi:hypothetical protein